jgi:hypothetical protein
MRIRIEGKEKPPGKAEGRAKAYPDNKERIGLRCSF